jgi:hypothetical protein
MEQTTFEDKLRSFFKERPSLAVRSVEREAGIPNTTLKNTLIKGAKFPAKHEFKLIPVLRKYGWSDVTVTEFKDSSGGITKLYHVPVEGFFQARNDEAEKLLDQSDKGIAFKFEGIGDLESLYKNDNFSMFTYDDWREIIRKTKKYADILKILEYIKTQQKMFSNAELADLIGSAREKALMLNKKK